MTTELAQPVYQTDPSGQTGPPGKRPKITATLWEDEGTLCFQVETAGICVARRAGERNCHTVDDTWLTKYKTIVTSMERSCSTSPT